MIAGQLFLKHCTRGKNISNKAMGYVDDPGVRPGANTMSIVIFYKRHPNISIIDLYQIIKVLKANFDV